MKLAQKFPASIEGMTDLLRNDLLPVIQQADDQAVEIRAELQVTESLFGASAVMADVTRRFLFQQIKTERRPPFRGIHFGEQDSGVHERRRRRQGLMGRGTVNRQAFSD